MGKKHKHKHAPAAPATPAVAVAPAAAPTAPAPAVAAAVPSGSSMPAASPTPASAVTVAGAPPEDSWGRAQRIRTLLNVASMCLLAFIILVAVNWLASRHWVRKDITFDASYTLSEKTRAVLDDLARRNQKVRVVCLWVVQSPLHGAVIPRVKDLLEEYRADSRALDIHQFDVASENRAAYEMLKELGVEQAQPNDIVICQGDVRKILHLDDLYQPELGSGVGRTEPKIRSFNAEQFITSALVSVTATRQIKLYWVTGHQEIDAFAAEPQGGLSFRTEHLEKRENLKVESLQLATVKEVPTDCDLLLLLAPKKRLTPEEIDTLRRYLRQGGKALISLFPPLDDSMRTGLEDLLLQEYGLQVRDDVIMDPEAETPIAYQDQSGQIYSSDMKGLLGKSYGAHEIVERMNETNPTLFFFSRSMEAAPQRPQDVTLTPLVYTTREAWGETDWRSKDAIKRDAKTDHAGPLVYAMAVRRKVGDVVEGAKVPEARLVVMGDTTLATNFYLDKIGRVDLLVNSVRWLAEQEHLISIEGKKPEDRKLQNLDQDRVRAIAWTLWGLVPFFAFMCGVTIWWIRRK